MGVIPAPHAQRTIKRLLNAWDEHPDCSGSLVGAAIATAAAAHELARTDPAHQLVLSGPTSSHVHVRATDQVLIDLINGAQHTLLLVTYSLSMHPELKSALQSAIGRGVAITVVAEDPRDNPEFKGKPGHALAGLAVARLRWPKDQRPEGWTSLHAKIAVVDQHSALVTSANLSLKASEHNFEAGVVFSGGDVATMLVQHIEQLTLEGVLVRA